MASLLHLQSQIKSNADAYESDFVLQLKHLENSLEVLKLRPSEENKDLVSLLQFISKTSSHYSKHVTTLPLKLIELLEQHQQDLHRSVRRQIVISLISFRNQDMIDSKVLLPVLFKLFRVHDKVLRRTVYFHILADIQRLNKKSKNSAVNRVLQNFMYSMLGDSFRIAAKKSLDIMIQLYRKGIWNDARTVNVISTACFINDTKMLVAACKFFLGVENDEDEEMMKMKKQEEEKDKGTLIKEIRMKFANTHSKKTRKKAKMYTKAIKLAGKSLKNKNKAQEIESINALHLLNDPQGFSEKLFNKLKTSNERFEVRVMMMDVISRCISANGLILLNFYPFIQKYLVPSQLQITRLLAITAQSVHEYVPPDVLYPVVMTVANNFANDRSKSEVITVGLNTIREICARQPLVMRKSLLRDLAQYAKSKNKNVFHAARGIITLYRHIDPKMLKKKDRGKNYDEAASLPQFGQNNAQEGLEGIELLDKYKEETSLNKDTGNESDDENEEWIDVSDESDNEALVSLEDLEKNFEHDADDESSEEESAQLDDDNEQLDIGIEQFEDGEEQTDEDTEQLDDIEQVDNYTDRLENNNEESDNDTDKQLDNAAKPIGNPDENETIDRKQELIKLKEEQKQKRIELTATKLLSDEDFALLKKIQQSQIVNKILKRKRSEYIDTDVIEEGNKKGLDDDSDSDTGEGRKKRRREEKEKWKKQRTHGGGKTKKENAKKKNWAMIKNSKKVTSKAVMGINQRKIRKQLSEKKQLKHKLKHR
jgi:protein SDA1